MTRLIQAAGVNLSFRTPVTVLQLVLSDIDAAKWYFPRENATLRDVGGSHGNWRTVQISGS